MDRGYRKGLRLEADRKSRSTWLGLLIASWVVIALLAWLDPFKIGHRRYEQPTWPPNIHLQTPERSGSIPNGVTLQPDGFGELFAFGTIEDAPTLYGTTAQLESAGMGRWDGPWSLTEAWSREARGEELIGKVGDAVRVVAFADPGRQEEHLIIIDVAGSGPSRTGPEQTKLVLARGCLRLGSAKGPLVLLGPRANGVYVDSEGWLAVGRFGLQQLRVGEVGEIWIDPPVEDETALNALRLQCGGNGDVVQISGISRKPVCDLTAEQAAANRAALTEQQRMVRDRMAEAFEEQVAVCMKQGRTRLACERSIPPMPPPPMPYGAPDGPVYQGLGPGERCVPQEDLPPGVWASDQSS